jgi:hypothetical protein
LNGIDAITQREETPIFISKDQDKDRIPATGEDID